ncbi:MAG: 4-hydroxy-tetrahydrodipicolinate reductase [Lactobacillaceae bacterium]|jgi:4-hydroxy-tetrahydrodipicolinate reductase|nr:4-hydroxy-tetrahydrodipicolinate reductase [Lactobacillaceae bacterium]
MKKVILAGGFGKMGIEIQATLAKAPDLELVGIFSATKRPADVPVFTDLAAIDVTADVWIDVTRPDVVLANAQYALTNGMDIVIGTSGLSAEQVVELDAVAQAHNQHGIVVPNFSLSAVLLMRFASEAAKYFVDAEVLEIHHPGKLDAPSGTAKATAALIGAARTGTPAAPVSTDAARGDLIAGVPVHAMRLPGYVAEEEVVFGAPGETLRIKQTSFSRESFMGGVVLAAQNVAQLTGVQVGLDKLL